MEPTQSDLFRCYLCFKSHSRLTRIALEAYPRRFQLPPPLGRVLVPSQVNPLSSTISLGFLSHPPPPPSEVFGTHFYSWVGKGTVRISCLAWEHNTRRNNSNEIQLCKQSLKPKQASLKRGKTRVSREWFFGKNCIGLKIGANF